MKNRIVAVVPAREGSERLPHKNRKDLCGKPLICWTIDEALKCDFFDEIIVTSDDEILLSLVEIEYENEKRMKIIQRPEFVARNDTPMWAVIDHALQGYSDMTVIFLLQPTSPLRTHQNIKTAWNIFKTSKMFGTVSGCWEYPEKEIRLNGAIFIHYFRMIRHVRSFIFNGVSMYIMPKHESIDIDTIDDFVRAEIEMEKRLETFK